MFHLSKVMDIFETLVWITGFNGRTLQVCSSSEIYSPSPAHKEINLNVFS